MFVLKRFFCLLFLWGVLAVAASGAAADYTGGTPGGAGTVTIDPETGDRRVDVIAPVPGARNQNQIQNQQQLPVFVYPQAGRPRSYTEPPASKPTPSPRPDR